MPLMDTQSLLTILGVLAGTGLFLRMVGKEKRRREKYLEYRVYEKTQADAERKRYTEHQAADAAAQVAELAPGMTVATEASKPGVAA